MKKRFVKALSVLLTAVTLVGCSGGNASSVDEQKLFSDMVAADTSLPEMTTVTSKDKDGELNFSTLCDFDYADVKGYAYAYASEGTPEEIAVVAVKDASDAAPLMTSIKEHIELRRGVMQEYSPEDVAMVDNYVLTYNGNLVTLIISSQSGLVQKVFASATEE